MANKIRVKRSIVTGATPSGAAGDFGELAVNLTDRKIYMLDATGAARLVADRIDDFATTRSYIIGDIALVSGALYRAVAAVPPGAFVPAQWQALGGAGGGSDAILKVPAGASTNTINLVGNPARKGLIITGNASQTANMLEVPGTATGDTRAAIIDASGFPVDRFAPNVFRVAQASHPFAYIGQAVAFAGGAWVLANASDPDRVAVAVVEQRIDANTFVLRTGGRISALQTGAFAGGTITTGATYYVSDTVPGQLTTTPSAIRPDPVLRALGGGAGLAVVGAGAASGNFVVSTGDTMTGPLTMAGVNELRFGDATTALYKQNAVPGVQIKVANTLAARVDAAGGASGYAETVITRQKGDARYLQLSGGTMTGGIAFPAGPAFYLTFGGSGAGITTNGGGDLALRGASDTLNILYYAGGGGPAAAPSASTILSRKMGDARYVQLAGGTMTGLLTLSGVPTAVGHAATKGYVDAQTAGRLTQADGDARYALRSLVLTGGTGIGTIGNLTANRTINLDLTYTDARYLRLDDSQAAYQVANGRVDIRSAHSSGAVTRFYGPSSAVAATVYASGTFAAEGPVWAGGLSGVSLVHTGGGAYLNNAGGGNTDLRFGGTSRYLFRSTGDLAGGNDVVTRDNGDARYMVKAPTVGVAGTYAMLTRDGSAATGPGAVVAGSALWYASAAGDIEHPGLITPTHPAGSWRCMGLSTSYGGPGGPRNTTLYVRIA